MSQKEILAAILAVILYFGHGGKVWLIATIEEQLMTLLEIILKTHMCFRNFLGVQN